MQGLHEKQKRVLEFLLDRKDGATLDELAAHLGITKTAAKEHVLKLESFALLSYRDEHKGVGRPRRHYLLSKDGHEVFPRQYSWLSNVLLAHLAEDMGPETVSKVMRELAHKISRSMAPKLEGAHSTAELLAKVTAILNELGYRASLKQSDIRKGAILEATNCVYHSVAKAHPELCQFDTQFIENATGGMNVKLETCIARGGSVCRFCIRKK